MLKNISNLGSTLNKSEQKSIKGGDGLPPVTELCVPLPREAVKCAVPINPSCCLIWETI